MRALRYLRRILCALTWHSWVPLMVEARVLCECSFCGSIRWISLDGFDKRR